MPQVAWTYSTLMQALQDWEVHGSIKFLNNIPNIIGLGERRLWGDLNVEEYDKTLDDGSITTTAGTAAVNKPSDVIQIRTAAYRPPSGSGNAFTYLEQRSSEYCQLFAPDPTVQAPPQYYFELGSGQIGLAPTPDKAYRMYFRYIGTPAESLTSAQPNTSTWLARAGSDALLAACLMEAEHFIKADDRYADMQSKYYQELLPRLRAELRKSVRAGDYEPYKPAAGPPAPAGPPPPQQQG
jgi:hypothetical protein